MRATRFVVALVVWAGLGFAQIGVAQTTAPAVSASGSSVPGVVVGPTLLVVEDADVPWRTAIGRLALANNTPPGLYNTAAGYFALYTNTTGAFNTASGSVALSSNTTGSSNTASGYEALFSNTSGASNTALGFQAGFNASTGSSNLFLGANVTGTADDTNTIRLGLPYDGTNGQNQTFIAGIYGTALPPGGFVPVYINAAGQLGTALPPPVTPGGTGVEALAQQLQAQQATNAELRSTVADLRARLARLEALWAVAKDK